MTKELRYGGYTAMPSDYESADGELATSLNLLNEDGALRPISSPKVTLSLEEGHQAVLIHSVPGQENLILLTGNKNGVFGLSWIKRTASMTSTGNATAIGTKTQLNSFRDIAIVGNTLAVATSNGVHYILWKDSSYKYLGIRPPFLPISFGAYKAGELKKDTSTTYSEVPRWSYTHYSGAYNGATMPHVSWAKEDEAFWAEVSNEAFGLLLSEVSDKVTAKGYVYQPFYIRYAFKLYDGSYSWHSAPVLMLVTTHRPIISIVCAAIDGDEAKMTVGCTLGVPYFGIAYRVFGTLESLKEWSDIVTGVDVFISSPIYTYNQDKQIGCPISKYNLFKDGTSADSLRPGGSSQSSTDNSENAFIGHYADAIGGPYIDHYISVSLEIESMRENVCSISKNDTFNDKIQHEFLFYKVASLELEELAEMAEMKRLPLIKNDLTNITSLEQLPDEYNSHATIIAGSLYTYNQRLMMGDLSIMPPKPLPVCSVVQTATKTTEASYSATEKVKVYTRVNGEVCVSEFVRPTGEKDAAPYPFEECFPRFIYHPDPSAYRMEITSAGGKTYSIPLKEHPHLNGAYWFGGLEGKLETGSETSEDIAKTSAPVSNKIYVSDINNPFIFPAENIVTVSCGRIFSLCSAAKALSQGQFGQFPLYAFTDNGVWALAVSSTGVISARQPITRDVCINADAITQIDSAVLFPTDRGIMLISGSDANCVSDVVNNNSPYDILQLPHVAELHSVLGHTADSCFPIQPFTSYLRTCRMLYDYLHQRIIVYNTDYSYAYVLSLKSNMWGMMYADIQYHINSYPEALAVNAEGQMVDFSSNEGDALAGLLVTRPLKLDAADVLKTVNAIIQRGNFRKGHVQSVLYGSRDLYNWSLVWSSKDHYMRGFSGTPYKYFRIALLCNLSQDESLYGATVQYEARKTNQIR